MGGIRSQGKFPPGREASGGRRRLDWRPSALQRAESLLAGVLAGPRPFLKRASGFLDWHERILSGLRPWPAWLPLSLEFRGGKIIGNEFPHRQGEGFGESAPGTLDEGSGPSVLRVSGRATPFAGKSWERAQSSRSLPAIRMAIFGTEEKQEREGRRRGGGIRGEILREGAPMIIEGLPGKGDRGKWNALEGNLGLSFPILHGSGETSMPSPSSSRFVFRMRRYGSMSPRKEVRGGYPRSSPVSFPAEHSEPGKDPSVLSSGASFGEGETGIPPDGRGWPKSPEDKVPGAIERLIERTVLPLPLPGLTLRILSPERDPPGEKKDTPSAGAPFPGEELSREPAPPSPPPSVDAVADKVMQKLQRLQRLERERRGMY
jgi:hypothetical protein